MQNVRCRLFWHLQAWCAALESAPMHLHILGICGTFMGGLAALAREAGHRVTGCDAGVYPPMSDQLRALGIDLIEGFGADQLALAPDMFVVGNVVSRARLPDGTPKFPLLDALMDAGAPYTSGPQWLLEQVLQGRHVLAVAGTHGKTTTTSMLAWILESAGLQPGFLVGGVPLNFGVSARLGGPVGALSAAPGGSAACEPGSVGACFVIEADEYDTAFFDKRSKFVHYRPLVAILNNLEFDHADIFPDVAAIQRQFHHLVRTVPRRGRLLVNGHDERLREVLAMGCWTPVERFGLDASFEWCARKLRDDGSAFAVVHGSREVGIVEWPLLGDHNVLNGLAALAACAAVGVDVAGILPALARFRSVKRRMEVVGTHAGITVYDDFAHHPTAIATTLAGLRAKVGDARIVVAMEPRSNSMRLGAHADALAPSLDVADAVVFLARPELPWDADKVIAAIRGDAQAVADADALVARLRALARAGDHVVFMSNGGFDGAPRRFLAALRDG